MIISGSSPFSSPYAAPASGLTRPAPATGDGNTAAGGNTAQRTDAASSASSASSTPSQLSEADQQLLARLQQRDREVRAHEMAHMAAAAGLVVRGANYSYQTGPDGQRYAVGGDVQIDVSAGRTPEESLDKANRIRRAALAPADPSPQDYAVAAQADRMALEARMEIATRQAEELAAAPGTTDTAARADAAQPAAPPPFDPRALEPSAIGGLISVYA